MNSDQTRGDAGLQAVVLAGGLATRLGKLARDTPKYLLPLAGEPFAHHQLRRLAACGVVDVVLCIGHLGEAIEAALGNGSRLGVRLRYSHEGNARLGTAGALRAALDLLAPSFIVTYGDSYLPFDYAAVLRALQNEPGAQGCMAVYANAGRYDSSNVELAELGETQDHLRGAQPLVDTGKQRPNSKLWVARYEKGGTDPKLDHIDYGATALRREVIARLPEGPSDLAPLLSELASRQQLLAYPAAERFYEIGSPAGYAELNALLTAKQQPHPE